MDGLRLEMPAASPRMSRTLNEMPAARIGLGVTYKKSKINDVSGESNTMV